MGNYKFKEDEPKKKVLNYDIISSDMKSEMKFQLFALIAMVPFIALLVALAIEWEGYTLYTTFAVCLLSALFLFVIYDMVSRYIKISKRKYAVELDTVIDIQRRVHSRAGRGNKVSYYLIFRNSGKYAVRHISLLEYTEVCDTLYVVRFEKKFGKRSPEAVYSTKRYEWKDE